MLKLGLGGVVLSVWAATAAWAPAFAEATAGKQEGGTVHLRVSPEGAAVAVDLSVLKAFLEKAPEDASKFKVQSGGAAAEVKDWKAEVAGAKPGGEIVISCEDPALKFTIKLEPADKRRAESGAANVFNQDAAWASVCDTGDGKWKQKSNDIRYGISTEGAQVTLDGVEVGSWTPLAKSGGGSLYLVSAKKLTAWVDIAQKCYDAILKEDWATYVSCFNKSDQADADKYADCRMYWNAVRKTVEKNSVEKFVFSQIRKSGTTEKVKCLLFKRIDDDGKMVGYETLINVTLEDGKWVVDLVSP